jgi:hypothetical protein
MSIRFVDTRKQKVRKQFDSLVVGDAFVFSGLLYIVYEDVKQSYDKSKVRTLMVTGSTVLAKDFPIDNYSATDAVDVVMTVKEQE